MVDCWCGHDVYGLSFFLQEVKASSVVFLIAGYETLSNLLAYVAYELAVNPGCQRKLQEELDTVFEDEVSCM